MRERHTTTPSHAPAPTGLPVYDAARWLRPPPPSVSLYARSGLGFLSQVGHSSDPSGPQEALVQPGPDHAVIILSHAGSYEGHIGGRLIRVDAPLAVCTSPPGVAQRWISQPNANRIAHLHINPTRLSALLPDRVVSVDFRFRSLTDPTHAYLAKALLARSAQHHLSTLEAESYAILLAPLLLGGEAVSDDTGSGLAPWQLRAVLDLMRASLDRDFRLAELAADARLSPFHFVRAFKISTGAPPHRYFVRLRIEAARALLASSKLSITDIAARVGYEDSGYFARLFRQNCGVTPAAYRRERRA